MSADTAERPLDENLLADEEWRLNNLYYIKDKQGNKVRFNMNWAQRLVYNGMWYLCIILKARQLGMTTFIQIFMLDRCLFNDNTNAGVIAHTTDDAQAFFDDKIKFAWDNLPSELREAIGEAKTDSKKELKFGNGSKIRVGTSMRSGTLQYLHISEFGKICAKYPEKAKEIISGALNTVAPGQFIFIESTAEGRQGRFYELCQTAEQMMLNKIKLTMMDYKFYFFPWWQHPDYKLEGEQVDVPEHLRDYFVELQREEDIYLTVPQMNWYVKKENEQGDDMKQEYPATSAEAFEKMLTGVVFAQQIRTARKEGRFQKHLPHKRGQPVNVFWDLGHNDTNSMWFQQRDGAWNNFINYYEHSQVDITHYMLIMDEMEKELGYQWGTMFLPHDGKTKHIEAVAGSVSDILRSHGYKVRVVNRTPQKMISIEDTRRAFSNCRFDRTLCETGIKTLEGYRWKWDEKGETFLKTPEHNYASNGADAFQTFGYGYKGEEGTFKQQLENIDGTGGRKYLRGRNTQNAITNPDNSHVV